jgi:hypothetical protein
MSGDSNATDSARVEPRPAEPGRWAARGSILAAYVCFTLNCTFGQLTAKQQPGDVWWLTQLVGWTSMLVVAAGIGLGIYGLVIGIRRRSETAPIAVIGLLLNLGIVFVMLWFMWMLRAARVQ